MAAHADLWGEITPSNVRTPASILREQASVLGAKTGHAIEGDVTTHISGGEFVHFFNLVVPALDNYSYELFRIIHGVSPYPVRVYGSVDKLPDEGAFLDWLGRTLSSAKTKRVLGDLLAQAK